MSVALPNGHPVYRASDLDEIDTLVELLDQSLDLDPRIDDGVGRLSPFYHVTFSF